MGPALEQFGITNALPDPTITLYRTYPGPTTVIGQNGAWFDAGSNAASVAAAETLTGAFVLPTSSSDSALVASFPTGAYTENVAGASGDTGVVLCELYDASSPPGSMGVHLVNVSARAQVSAGAGALIAGFVVGGSTAKTLLIRATGPGLFNYGIQNSLPAPLLSVYTMGAGGTSSLIASNDDWEEDPVLAAAAAGVYAFGQAPGDAAVLVMVPPGAYTANVTLAPNVAWTPFTGSVALIEVYEVE